MSLFATAESVRVAPWGTDLLIRCSEDRVEDIKESIPGIRRWITSDDWIIPGNYEATRILRDLRIPFTGQATKFAVTQKAKETRLCALSEALDYDLELPGFGKEPFPFQRAGIAYGLEQKRVLIGDEMGLGKTIQALATLYASDAFPALIITPASNKYQWGLAEIPACMKDKIVIMATKDTGLLALMAADVIVTNYDQMLGRKTYKYNETQPDGTVKTKTSYTVWEDQTAKKPILSDLAKHMITTIRPRTIILDEAHGIKDPATARTCAIMSVRHSAEYRILLTGSPLLNAAKDFWSYIKFLDYGHHFGGMFDFLSKYCGLKKTKFGLKADGAHHTKELNTKMRSLMYVRRKKEVVLTQLPPKVRTSYLVDLDNRPEYDKAEEELIEWVKDRVLRDKAFLESIAHLSDIDKAARIHERQTSKAEAAERAEQIVRLNALKTVAAEGKVNAGIDFINNFKESGEKLVVFATHKSIIERLRKAFPDAARILAEDSPEERQANVRRFQTVDKCWLLIGAMGTSAGNSPAGVGHTLTAASNVLFFELGWNPALHDQCEDRCHRIGQLDSVTAHYLLGRDTVDQEIADLIESKRQVSAQVVDGEEGEVTGGIIDNVINFLARKGGVAAA